VQLSTIYCCSNTVQQVWHLELVDNIPATLNSIGEVDRQASLLYQVRAATVDQLTVSFLDFTYK